MFDLTRALSIVFDRPPFHIIMQKDQHASNIRIPSVFVSYAAGAKILYSMQSAVPWNPVTLTLSSDGERTFRTI